MYVFVRLFNRIGVSWVSFSSFLLYSFASVLYTTNISMYVYTCTVCSMCAFIVTPDIIDLHQYHTHDCAYKVFTGGGGGGGGGEGGGGGYVYTCTCMYLQYRSK